ncbi:MAG: prolyl oligopeptidase family serine peptidase [Chitinophagaceae bacterium]|nr:prolyl oligopeptidase family serine peptidase [Chitinophagaceae bacterium]
MKKFTLLLIALIAFSMNMVQAQDKSLYEKHWFIQRGDTLPYRLLLPLNYDSSKKYPLVFFLHGRGESGRDNEKQLTHIASFFLKDSIREQYPAIILFPQCPWDDYWSNVDVTMVADGSASGKRSFHFLAGGPPSTSMQLLSELVDDIFTRYPVKTRQVYIMGLSMGGMGTFELVRRKPGVFAAAVPICGGADPSTASQLKNTSWWVFHGAKDDVVLPEHSEKMVTALKKNNVQVRFTLFQDANHNSWDPAFNEPELMPWLFSKRKR